MVRFSIPGLGVCHGSYAASRRRLPSRCSRSRQSTHYPCRHEYVREGEDPIPYRPDNDSAHSGGTERITTYKVVQLLQVYARLAELEIAAGEKPRAGDVALPQDTAKKAKEWAEGEAEREKQREALLGRLRAVGKDPMAALEEMGG